MVVTRGSLPLIIRVMISVRHDQRGEGRRADENALAAGPQELMMTPEQADAVAIQRRRPTFSLRMTIDSAVTNSGARSRWRTPRDRQVRRPEMKTAREPSSAAPRSKCSRAVRSATRTWMDRSIAGDMISAEYQEADPGNLDRRQTRERYFA